MIGIDVGVLNLDQLDDHVCRRREALIQHWFHHIADLVFKSLESIDVLKINTSDNISQLFVDFVSAFKGWLKKTSYLLTHKDFKGHFWNKKTWWKSLSIFNCCLNIMLCQVLEGVNIFDRLDEYVVENEIYPWTSKALKCTVFDKLSLDHLPIGVRKLVN